MKLLRLVKFTKKNDFFHKKKKFKIFTHDKHTDCMCDFIDSSYK